MGLGGAPVPAGSSRVAATDAAAVASASHLVRRLPVLVSCAVRGPLLSGPLGASAVLEALLARLRGVGPVAVIGPLWLGEALAAELPVLALFEPEQRPRARRIARRSAAAGRRLGIVMAGGEVPLGTSSVSALVVEDASALDPHAAEEWMAALVPVLRAGGCLIAADVTEDPGVEARLSALFLASTLVGIAQDRPRDGVVLTTGRAPSADLVRARFGARV
jgi:hypothetical protein